MSKQTSSSTSPNNDHILFIPRHKAKYLEQECLRITWFETAFSQSNYSFSYCANGSNACTLIVILTATKCQLDKIKITEPEKELNINVMFALAFGMAWGNAIHENLKASGALCNINLTVPEAIKYSGDYVQGIKEWKSILYQQPLSSTLYENLKHQWRKWCQYCNLKKIYTDFYVVLISDHRSVLFIIQNECDTVTLIDSHQHTQTKGAFITTTKRSKLKILCDWFTNLIGRCYQSYPQVYELSFLYFKNAN